MIGMEWILNSLLVVLLTATLFHAVRLERALGVLKRDRAALEALVVDFNASTHAAETGVDLSRINGSGPHDEAPTPDSPHSRQNAPRSPRSAALPVSMLAAIRR